MYEAHSKIHVQVYLTEEFLRKKPMPAQGFEPTTFWLVSSSKGIYYLPCKDFQLSDLSNSDFLVPDSVHDRLRSL